MNILQLVPGIMPLLDKFIPDPEQKQKMLAEMQSLRIQQMEAENDRVAMFSGPLTLMLYGLAVYFYIVWIGPLFGVSVPPMPDEMYSTCKWILAFLIPSETFNQTEINFGSFHSPAGKGIATKGVKR